jgi:mono/diheme cytochrome c family protein
MTGRGWACIAAIAWTLGLAGVVAQGALPASAGVEIAQARCLSCHGADLIVSQRLSEAGWGREVDKMVRWGAQVGEAERGPLVTYLARHFPVTPVAVPASEADASGEATFTRACLGCHGRDLTEQQRLSPAGWTREVEKMMRWGAVVSDAEKAPLVRYLADRYGVR